MTRPIHPEAVAIARALEPTWPSISAAIARSGVPTCEATADMTIKEKLKSVEAELTGLREERIGAVAARDAAREAFAGTKDLSQTSDEFKAASAAVARVGEVEDRIANAQEAQVGLLKILGGSGGRPAHSTDAPPHADTVGWDARAMLRDTVQREALEQMASTQMRVGRLALGQVASRDALAASFGSPLGAAVAGTPNMRRGEYAGVVPQLRRNLRILDLIPTGTMDQNSLPYTQESGSFTTAAETAEGTTKPEAAVTYTDQTADAATIAHWLKNNKQVLADFPALQSLIDGRLRYGVERRLEAEVLTGDGSSPNMRGILNTTGIGNVAYDADELTADQILSGLTTVFLADAEANAIVLHPLDWQTALRAKAQGDGHYFSGGPFSVTPQQMWGTPLIPSAAVAQGTALIADFALGAQLFIREGVNVLVSDSDQDDFIKNRITMLAEMRAALAVFRPAAFCVVHLAA